ncbi:MAG: hypothetical protein GXY58_08665 [Planctomycetaceae bacterium]|nr:hypothetical protein [Planctomycetaceae bacterium]
MTGKRNAKQAADVLNVALAEARQTLFRAEQQALGLLVGWPDGERLREGLTDLMARRFVGDRNEPPWIEPFELAAMVERTLGPCRGTR